MAIIWLALLVSQLLFLVVMFFAKREIFNFDFSRPLLGENSAMVIALAVLGVLTFLLSFILRRKFVNQAINEQKTELVQTAMIIGCALCEATTLFGLVLAFALSYQYFSFGLRSAFWELFFIFRAAKISSPPAIRKLTAVGIKANVGFPFSVSNPLF